MSGLKLLAGLGNPGDRYAETRHNAGFWFLDAVCREQAIVLKPQFRCHGDLARACLHGCDCLLLRPSTFMNKSGLSVRATMDYFKVEAEDLLVVYDELDLPPGTARLKYGGGHGGHNGLRDIFRHVPNHEFARLRVGIGHPGHKDAVTDYVLSKPSATEEGAIRASIDRAIGVLPDIVAGNLQRAMNSLHTPDVGPG